MIRPEERTDQEKLSRSRLQQCLSQAELDELRRCSLGAYGGHDAQELTGA